ncbi:hypothetical protein PISL3812_09992 [Talaromyces islandicus]|uniref:Uncharacterized protein n=1 Tax=Talaromyces islandicus TaxID=28573 RepID=A0A0U1MBC7_TALIS|nr:hypothetical protein PISL3812_09992 [Talaromyces islandicus]
MHIDEPRVRGVTVAPHLFEQHFPGEDLPGLTRQRDQQIELQRGQRDRLPVPLHRVTRHVDHQIADRELLRRGLLGAPQPRTDPRHQLLGLERLDDVVIGAGLQAHHHVDGVALRRQHDDRHPGLGPDQPAHLDAVPAGQHEIEQHQIGLGLTESGQSPVTVRDERRLEALAAQHDAEHLGQCGVVIDDENASLHTDIIPLADRDLA